MVGSLSIGSGAQYMVKLDPKEPECSCHQPLAVTQYFFLLLCMPPAPLDQQRQELADLLVELQAKIAVAEQCLSQRAESDPQVRRVRTHPGIGPEMRWIMQFQRRGVAARNVGRV